MVAVGNLEKVWLTVPENVAEKSLKDAFRNYFGAEWSEVLDVTDKSFTYNSTNNAYFAVSGLRPLENLSLEQLLEKERIGKPQNIIVS